MASSSYIDFQGYGMFLYRCIEMLPSSLRNSFVQNR